MCDFTDVIANNLTDHLLLSKFDYADFKNTELCLGIDEAGRGPVLGPMVYSALFCPLKEEQKLKKMECADSKALTEAARDKIFKKINENGNFCGYATKVLSPHSISTGMLRREKYNLNELSHDTAICLIDHLYIKEKLPIVQVFLDTVGDPTKYEQKLLRIFPKLKIKVSKKADALFPCVSAASICAKVTRDHALRNWKFIGNKMSVDKLGSGYPADPNTKKYLNDIINPVFGFTKIVRFSWSTAAVLMDKKCVAVKWADLDEDDDVTVLSDDEDSEENRITTAKKAKKPESKKPANKNTKISQATAKEKNNSSLLSFFGAKAQKRSAVKILTDLVDFNTVKCEFMVEIDTKFATALF